MRPQSFACRLALAAVWLSLTARIPAAQELQVSALPEPPPTVAQRTRDFQRFDGFFPLYWDERTGRVYVEIPALGKEVLLATGLATGLGSNDIGLDRGSTTGSRIVLFERSGPRVLMVQPNYHFRAHTANTAEARTVREAFARSVLWSFPIVAATGSRVLVDYTGFLVRDWPEVAGRLGPGSYRFDAGRSTVYVPGLAAFPRNSELEAELTFVRQPAGGAGGEPDTPGGRFFEGVGSVAASPEAASFRVHHSIVELPEPGFEARAYDPRSGFLPLTYQNYSALPGEPITVRLAQRHRLKKRNPEAPLSEPVQPIVYYLDPGTPEPVRSALLDGARWWNQAFEAAGYRNAFRVEMLPEDASPLDVRYNVINWVHRSTRGWSYGASVTDPRTGEIIKGVVTLGSLRIRQDYLIAEGLLSPYASGTETPPALLEWGLARIRQLSAHEVGHTLGIGHNYYGSREGRVSVMDYPHPLVRLNADGTIDASEVYATGIGHWDKVAVRWGYQDFPEGVDQRAALDAILDEGHTRDLMFLTNQDVGAHANVNQWSNGTDAAAELQRMMRVRQAALARFGDAAIRRGQPLATMEEVLVPLYLHHRYQVEAACAVLGGLYYTYALRGDSPAMPVRFAPADEQRRALDAILETLQPSALALPQQVLQQLPPRPPGWPVTRELFPRYTGQMFDAIAPAVTAADLTLGFLLTPARAARLVEQHALDPTMPGLHGVIQRLVDATFGAAPADPYHAEIARAVQRVVVEHLMTVASNAEMSQVRAIATAGLRGRVASLRSAGTGPAAAHRALLAADIERFLERPAPPAVRRAIPAAPPGAPIGEPAMHWLDRREPACGLER